MVYIFVQIKFRIFLWTMGYVRHVFRLGLPIPIPLPDFSQVIFDDRGVLVHAANRDLWTGMMKIDKIDAAEITS